MSVFRFKQFSVKNEKSAMKVGTDGVLLGSAMTITGFEKRMLDVGTGTGLIALMAAQRNAQAEITAVDIDEASAREAAYNFAKSPFSERLTALCTPLSRFSPENSFNLIFSNPPYYDTSLLNPKPRQAAARHTETLFYRDLCAFAAEYLTRVGSGGDLPGKAVSDQEANCENPQAGCGLKAKMQTGCGLEAKTQAGRLSIILPSDCERELLRTAASYGLQLFRILRIRTTPTKPFSRIIAEFTISVNASLESLPLEEELTLLQEDGSRSPEYKALTSEFYL
jgi:tRNA1Val (adenine37-N6)-methyltransferase